MVSSVCDGALNGINAPVTQPKSTYFNCKRSLQDDRQTGMYYAEMSSSGMPRFQGSKAS